MCLRRRSVVTFLIIYRYRLSSHSLSCWWPGWPPCNEPKWSPRWPTRWPIKKRRRLPPRCADSRPYRAHRFDILVAAATSADPQLADEAQLLISGLLRQYQRKIDAGKGVRGVSRQLTDLADALGDSHQAFSHNDYTWLSGTVRKILRLANQIAPSHSPAVALQCDTVLATIAANEAQIARIVNRDLAAASGTVPIFPSRPSATDGRLGKMGLSPSSEPFSDRSATTRESTQTTSSRVAGQSATPRHIDRPALQRIRLAERTAPPQPSSAADSQVIAIPPAAMGEISPNSDAQESNHALAWTYPMLNIAPAMPIRAMPARATQPTVRESLLETQEQAAQDDAIMRPLANDAARDLLRRWLTAQGSDLYAIEEELTYRGFGRLSGRLVEQLFSDDVEDRLRLVDDVLTAPGIDARPWLVLLADDDEADVRLLVLTIMATSDDPTLLDKAWQVALHDRDPRIAGLATRLRERRDTAQRR